MRRNEFESLVAEAYASLPEWVKEKISNVALVVEDEPSEEVRREQALSDDETLFGLYIGVPLVARGDAYGVGPTLPDKIIIYRLPILAESGEDRDVARKIVRDTVFHEFAHHFGMSEREVREREKRGW